MLPETTIVDSLAVDLERESVENNRDTRDEVVAASVVFVVTLAVVARNTLSRTNR